MTHPRLTRHTPYLGRLRLWRVVSLLLLVSVTLTGCGTGRSPEAEPQAATPTAEVKFPVSIEHKYGSTEILEQPERVVTVGLTDQDPVLALGVTPVGTVEWTGEYPGAIGPWAEDELKALGTPLPEVVSSFAELNFEKIASLRPDLILGLYSGMKKEEYETLAQIAPTIAQSGRYADYGMPWQEITLTIGRALGRTERAEQVIAHVEERFAQARREHPEFEGKPGVLASTDGEGSYSVYKPADPRVRFLASLGLKMPAHLMQRFEEAGGGGINISDERFDAVDVDLLIWFVEGAADADALRANPVYKNLAVPKEGRDIFLAPDSAVYGAYNFNTVLSLPFALDRLLPRIAAAVDGNPVTQPTSGS